MNFRIGRAPLDLLVVLEIVVGIEIDNVFLCFVLDEIVFIEIVVLAQHFGYEVDLGIGRFFVL